eukprot:6087466-Pyramimonas_sp.AAC.1
MIGCVAGQSWGVHTPPPLASQPKGPCRPPPAHPPAALSPLKRLHLRAGLDNVQVASGASLCDPGEDVLLVLDVVHQGVLGVLDPVLGALVHGDAVVQPRPRKPLQVLPVGVRAEDERVLHKEAHTLGGVAHHLRAGELRLAGHEGQRTPGVVAHERLPQPAHHLRVNLVGVVRLRVHRVDHKGVRGGHHLLN